MDECGLAGPCRADNNPATELELGTVWVRDRLSCCSAADNSDRASCHNAGTRRETNGATIDPASRTASQLTDLADQVPPSAPARAPAPLPPRSARRPSPHPQKGPRSSATSRATETRSTSAGSRLSFEKLNIRPHRGQPPGHRYPRHSLAVGSNDRYPKNKRGINGTLAQPCKGENPCYG